MRTHRGWTASGTGTASARSDRSTRRCREGRADLGGDLEDTIEILRLRAKVDDAGAQAVPAAQDCVRGIDAAVELELADEALVQPVQLLRLVHAIRPVAKAADRERGGEQLEVRALLHAGGQVPGQLDVVLDPARVGGTAVGQQRNPDLE